MRNPEMRVPVFTTYNRRFKLDIRSREPTEIHDITFVDATDAREVVSRIMTLAARTSYMVGQPNRRVFCRVDLWDDKRREWDVVMEFETKVKDRPTKQRYPGALG